MKSKPNNYRYLLTCRATFPNTSTSTITEGGIRAGAIITSAIIVGIYEIATAFAIAFPVATRAGAIIASAIIVSIFEIVADTIAIFVYIAIGFAISSLPALSVTLCHDNTI